MTGQQFFHKFKYLILVAIVIPGVILIAAPTADPTGQPLNYMAPPDMNTFNVSEGTAVAYTPWFENGTWQGDLFAYAISTLGDVGSLVWAARAVFADTTGANANDNAAPGDDYWNNRIIVTTDGGYGGGWSGNKPGAGNQIPFRYNDYSTTPSPSPGTVLHQTQQNAITATVADQDKIIKFVRGFRGDEKISTTQAEDTTKPNLSANSSGTLRERYSILGDIIHSTPKYVGPPSLSYLFDDYLTFKSNNSGRAARVYVGANDGMLHAFDASSDPTQGQEVFAYVPSTVIGNLDKLADLNYTHTYFVDGELDVTDVYGSYDGCTTSPCWRTVLVGALGAGGKGFYGLDVTTPPTTTDTEATAKARVLWEIGAPGATADADLGYTLARPKIVKLKNGKWVAIAGNGYDSANGSAVLYFIDLESGAVAKVDTGSGSAGDKNGLSSPTVIDSNGDAIADYVYAGDLEGDMWRFDLTGISTSGSPISTAEVSFYKLYDGTNAQPITAAPAVRDHPKGGFMVMFGTGRAITDSDLADTTVQAVYGLHDSGAAITTPSLVTQTYQQLLYTGPVTPQPDIRLGTSNTSVDYSIQDGWKVELPAGERILTHVQIRADRAQFTITNTTGTAYDNWLMQLDSLSGGAPTITVFDLNADNTLSDTDRQDGNGDGDLIDREDIPAAMQFIGTTPIRVASRPVLLFLASGLDTILVINEGLTPIITTVCTLNCDILGGHIDVDTDSPSGGTVAAGNDGLGGETDGHFHEYDVKQGQPFVDYFSLEPTRTAGGGKLNRVTEVYERGTTTAPFSNNQEFIVLLANADLSPGGVIIIGDQQYNVLDYQRAIINRIQTGTLTKTGDVHTLQKLLAFSGTTGSKQALTGNWPTAAGENIAGALRIALDDQAILTGGLVPTNTGCVRDNDEYFGRWRAGALTIHLLQVDTTVAGWETDVINKVVIQNYDASDQANTGETYTGVRVANNSDFLFESTLFWHYEDIVNKAQRKLNDFDSSLYPGVTKTDTPCYGKDGWVEAKDTIYSYTEADILTLIDQLNQAITDLEAAGEEKKAEKLAELRDELLRRGTGGGGGGTPPVEAATEGGLQDAGVTSGVDINTGQRSWRDFGVY